MTKSTTRRLWLRSALAAGSALLLLSAATCIPEAAPEVDPDGVSFTDSGTVDWTTYAGLHIYAHQWVTENNGERYMGYGPVDIVLFENAVVSECYNDITGEFAGEYGKICAGVDVDKPFDNTPEAYCEWAICEQSLAICAGYRNLSLADAVDAVEFSTRPLTIAKDYPEYVSPGGTYDRGRVNIRHVLLTDPEDGVAMHLDPFPVRYKVPPQSPGDRTLLYETAMEFFRAAGIVSGEAIERGCLNPEEVPSAAWSATPFAGIAGAGTGGTSAAVAPREMALAGFQEAVLRFNDVLERLVRNEGEVSGKGGSEDTVDRQHSRWNGEVNSRLSAMRPDARQELTGSARQKLTT